MAKRIPKIPGLRSWKKIKPGSGMRPAYAYKLRNGISLFIFSVPNKASQGPITGYYGTNGDQAVTPTVATKTEVIRHIKRWLKEHLRGNPLTGRESLEEMGHAQRALDVSKRISQPRGAAFAAGLARGTLQTVQRHGPPHAARRATDMILGSARANPPAVNYIEVTRLEGHVDRDDFRTHKAWSTAEASSMLMRLAHTVPVGDMHKARIRVYWTDGRSTDYRADLVRGQMPDVDAIISGQGRAPNHGGASVAHRNPMTSYERQNLRSFAQYHDDMAVIEQAKGDPRMEAFYAGEAAGAEFALQEDSRLKTKRKKAKRKKNPRKKAGSKAEFRHVTVRPAFMFQAGTFRTVPFSHLSAAEKKLAKSKARVSKIPRGTEVRVARFKKGKGPSGKRVKHLAWGLQGVLIPLGKRKNPPRKARPAAKKAPVKHPKKKSRPKKRTNQPATCKHTLALERGSKDKLTVCYPGRIFSSLRAAVLNIQKELRAKFGRLKKAPRITRAEWKFSDAAKTKGRWHFTASKAA